MNKILIGALVAFLAVGCSNQDKSKGEADVANQQEIVSNTDVYKPELLSVDNRFEQGITFFDKGNKCLIGLSDSIWDYKGLLLYSLEDDIWKLKDTLTFGFNMIGEPMFSEELQTLFFIAYNDIEGEVFQTDIYTSMYENGAFGEASVMGSTVNSKYSEWHPSIAENGNLYFSSERRGEGTMKSDIYMCEYKDGKYQNAVRLTDSINTDKNDSDPLIAPDESYIIVQSDREGGQGKHDFYVSFKTETGWTTPHNLGQEVNSDIWEIGPSFSPDYKSIWFTRRTEWKTDSCSKLFVFDVARINELTENVKIVEGKKKIDVVDKAIIVDTLYEGPNETDTDAILKLYINSSDICVDSIVLTRCNIHDRAVPFHAIMGDGKILYEDCREYPNSIKVYDYIHKETVFETAGFVKKSSNVLDGLDRGNKQLIYFSSIGGKKQLDEYIIHVLDLTKLSVVNHDTVITTGDPIDGYPYVEKMMKEKRVALIKYPAKNKQTQEVLVNY